MERRNFKYSFNDTIFSEVNALSSNLAGFIAGDGCICDSRNSLTFSLNEKDTTYLIEFKDLLNYTGPISLRTPNVCRLNIVLSGSSKKDLENNFSVTPRKSLTLKRPNINELNNKLAFIIGLIDADGCLGIFTKTRTNENRRPYTYVSLNILGSEDILTFVKETFEEIVPARNSIGFVKRGNIYSLSITCRRAEELIRVLLQTEVPHRLSRKWDKFQYLLEGKFIHSYQVYKT